LRYIHNFYVQYTPRSKWGILRLVVLYRALVHRNSQYPSIATLVAIGHYSGGSGFYREIDRNRL
jgi:hypothetical protein